MNSGTKKDLWGIWGRAADDLFAAGSGGVVLHYDGDEWNDAGSEAKQGMPDVWGGGRSVF